MIVEAALLPSAAPAGGTEILIVGEAAGLGGRLMRTVCFLDSCEPPAAGGCVVSSGIVQKFKRPQILWTRRRRVKCLKKAKRLAKGVSDPGQAVSRILSARTGRAGRGEGHLSYATQPGASMGRAIPDSLFGLAPNGVYRAPSITLGAVGSYPTFSPLPRPKPWRFVFCGTFRQSSSRINCPRVSSAEPGLHGIVSCGVRTFLPRQLNAGSDPPPFQGGTDYRRKRARAQASSSVMSRV